MVIQPGPRSHTSTPHQGHSVGYHSGSFRWSCIGDLGSFRCPPLGMSLLPSVNVGHVQVQVPHMGESMVGHRTPCNPAMIRTFMIRVVSTVGLVFPPCLFNLKRIYHKMGKQNHLGEPPNQPHVWPYGACAYCEHLNIACHTLDRKPYYLAHMPVCAPPSTSC